MFVLLEELKHRLSDHKQQMNSETAFYDNYLGEDLKGGDAQEQQESIMF